MLENPKKNILCTSSVDNHLKIGAQNKNKKLIWTLGIMLKYPCSEFFFKIMSKTLMIIVKHFFYILNVNESKKKVYRTPFPWITTSK